MLLRRREDLSASYDLLELLSLVIPGRPPASLISLWIARPYGQGSASKPHPFPPVNDFQTTLKCRSEGRPCAWTSRRVWPNAVSLRRKEAVRSCANARWHSGAQSSRRRPYKDAARRGWR